MSAGLSWDEWTYPYDDSRNDLGELGRSGFDLDYLLDKLNLQTGTFELKKIGDMELRGKEQKVMLYTL